ncbi:hypothetical protein HANVADRAFT_92288 [Hanseniaspora valbyensis NRRL Y-1626]|uniref:Uncharacterized protein n=1 Tax=Hanseniaspora valbyensis NRRL Y-1626 TaxID=766949 RepID=A0A1B7TIH4_9ASCO|nr:hypothetical protein HANVADRAFT_92288 [Hanseniaspora valbyensis NRRL Y-1626]
MLSVNIYLKILKKYIFMCINFSLQIFTKKKKKKCPHFSKLNHMNCHFKSFLKLINLKIIYTILFSYLFFYKNAIKKIKLNIYNP